MSHLQGERRFFVREPEFLRLRPDRGDLRRGAARPHQFDRRIEVIAATLVGVVDRARRRADRELR